MTVRDSLQAAVGVLTRAGFTREDAQRDAAVLARHRLGWTLAEWALGQDETATPAFSDPFHGLVARRAAHEPVAYLTGSREFYGREFRVTSAVLIPRPETELVVEAAIALARDVAGAPFSILDVGTGSGCLAVTLALECPGAQIVATDTSAAALGVAAGNAERLGAHHIPFVLVDQGEFVPREAAAPDLIVCNPPYVPERDRASLQPDVRDYEPASALFAGEDGLDVIRAFVPAAADRLGPGGQLIMEFGDGQAHAVEVIVREAGLAIDAIRHDLRNVPRVVIARRPVA